MTSDIIVTLDDRVRLMSALLAATRYPEQAQHKRPHGTHAHARASRKYLAPFASHEAATTLQSLLEQGAPLEALFALALMLRPPDCAIDKPPRWMPSGWNEQICDFQTCAKLAQWWQHEDAAWSKALADTRAILETMSLKPFLQPFVGEIKERFVFVPSILYPTDQELAFRLGGDLVAIIPPRLAWGDSAPWPFHEDPAHIYRAAIMAYAAPLMNAYLRANAAKLDDIAQHPLPVSDALKAAYPHWADQFSMIFTAGVVAIYLEDHVSPAEANAFILMEKKVKGLDVLPGTVSVLRRYLADVDSGRYASLFDFLPGFSRQLRVAQRIVTL